MLSWGTVWRLLLRTPRLSPDVSGESEVLQRIVPVRGAGAGQGQAGDLAAQPVPALQVQGAVAPGLLPSSKAALMDGHVGQTGGRAKEAPNDTRFGFSWV